MSGSLEEVSGSASCQLPALHCCRSTSSCCSKTCLQLTDPLGLHLITNIGSRAAANEITWWVAAIRAGLGNRQAVSAFESTRCKAVSRG